MWSPFCAYEKPEALIPLFESFEEDDIRAQFARVKEYQGLPVAGTAEILREAVGQGILLANSIRGSGGQAAFAFLPYRAGPATRRMEKIVLEKALILLACVRYGQHYAQHSIRLPGRIIEALLDGRQLRATTEAHSQYASAAQAQLIMLEPARVGVGIDLVLSKRPITWLPHGSPSTSSNTASRFPNVKIPTTTCFSPAGST